MENSNLSANSNIEDSLLQSEDTNNKNIEVCNDTQKVKPDLSFISNCLLFETEGWFFLEK